jgi:hypothetical protein
VSTVVDYMFLYTSMALYTVHCTGVNCGGLHVPLHEHGAVWWAGHPAAGPLPHSRPQVRRRISMCFCIKGRDNEI